MTKLEFVNELIQTIEDEFDDKFSNGSFSIIKYVTKEGEVIETDVGYAVDWFNQYKNILRKRYTNIGRRKR